MEIYEIANKKSFMNKLLKSDLFDTFELREALIHTSFKAIIDGVRNKDFFDTEALETLSPHLTWGEVRPYIYQLIMGAKSPSYFKIILSTSTSKTLALSPELDTCFLNIVYKENQISCTTGVAYKGFTLDKTPDKLWDERIKNFLFKYEFF